MKDGRERLRSGIFRANGRKVDDDPRQGRLEGEVELFSAFDYDKDLLRFDRLEPEREWKPNQSDGEGTDPLKAWTTGTIGGKFARTPTKSITWVAGTRVVAIQPPEKSPPGMLKPFDVRILGLTYWPDLWDGHTLAYYQGAYSIAPSQVVLETNGIYRLKWTFGIADSVRVLWIDEKHGFTPIR